MSLNLQNAFDMIIGLKGKAMSLDNIEDDIQLPVKVAQSNYFRNFSAPGDMEIPGREFIISNTYLVGSTIPVLTEGMRLIEVSGKEHVITEIVEMPGLGGEILGYRLRTE